MSGRQESTSPLNSRKGNLYPEFERTRGPESLPAPDSTVSAHDAHRGMRPIGFLDTSRDFALLLPIVGPFALLLAAAQRLRSPRSSKWYPVLQDLVREKRGLEIGGPSPIFFRSGKVPVYDLLASCDNVDFAHETIWTGAMPHPAEFEPEGTVIGRQMIQDGVLLPQVPDGSCDVILSSHVLEHLANPLRALENWKRVLAEPGWVLMVVPDGTRTFDHRREVTPVPHMILDFEGGTGEDDISHLHEVLERHDLRLDRAAGSREDFERRSRRNVQYRALHHHVFSPETLRGILESAGLKVLMEARVSLCDLLVVAAKSRG